MTTTDVDFENDDLDWDNDDQEQDEYGFVDDDDFDNEENEDWPTIDFDQDENQNAKQATIENLFHEGEYEQDNNVALQKMLQVIEEFNKIENSNQIEIENSNEVDISYLYKAISKAVQLYIQQQNKSNTKIYYNQLLSLSEKMTENEFRKMTQSILNSAKKIDQDEDEDQDSFYSELLCMTLDFLKQQFAVANQEKDDVIKPINNRYYRMWFKMSIDLCVDYLVTKTLPLDVSIKSLMAQLHAILAHFNSTEVCRELLLLYAVEIELVMTELEDYLHGSAVASHSVDNACFNRLRELYSVTKQLVSTAQQGTGSAAMEEPRVMCYVYECWGKMDALSGDWATAYQYLLKSFQAYQAIAHANMYSVCQCLFIAYMMLDTSTAVNTPNPFTLCEIQVIARHPDIAPFESLLQAFENENISEFEQVVQSNYEQIFGVDNELHLFVKQYICQTRHKLQQNGLLHLVKSYARVRLDWLATKLYMSLSSLERLVVNLISDGMLNARLDQIEMVLYLDHQLGKRSRSQLYSAMSDWATRLADIQSTFNLCLKSDSTINYRSCSLGSRLNHFEDNTSYIDDSNVYWQYM